MKANSTIPKWLFVRGHGCKYMGLQGLAIASGIAKPLYWLDRRHHVIPRYCGRPTLRTSIAKRGVGAQDIHAEIGAKRKHAGIMLLVCGVFVTCPSRAQP
jgi:hypothetical protein